MRFFVDLSAALRQSAQLYCGALLSNRAAFCLGF
jgi:hypothetical protein